MRRNDKLGKIIAVIIALAAWQIVCTQLGSGVLLASPIDVAARVIYMLGDIGVWATAGLTLGKIMSGFALAFIAGCLLAALSSRYRAFETLIWPYMAAIKSTPVASFIVLCLVWLSAGNLSVFIAFLMAMPVVYQNLLTALKNVDESSLRMADVFGLSRFKRFKYIYLPSIKPHVYSAVGVSIALAWKAGVAAEVIGIPSGSIGAMLYEAKLYLDTRELFSWTVIVVALSIAMEKTVMFIIRRLYAALEATR